MNILLMVDSVSTLFPKKVNITLVHAESREIIANHALNDFPLPEQFNKPTILDISGSRWRVLKVDNLRSGNYFRAAKIQLHVLPPDSIIPTDKYLVPTLAPLELTPASKVSPVFNTFSLHITHDEWLQFQFLPLSALEQIQETTAMIESIINSPDDNNNLLGYATSHTRDLTSISQLEIPFDDFCTFTNITARGNILLPDDIYIENGIALESSDHIYYGILNNGIITTLAIKEFDCLDEELSDVLARYDLTFVDWCNASILG